MAALAIVSRAAVVCLAMTGVAARAAEAEVHGASVKPVCLNAADTRDQVKTHKLLEPYAALKFAAAAAQGGGALGEALRQLATTSSTR